MPSPPLRRPAPSASPLPGTAGAAVVAGEHGATSLLGRAPDSLAEAAEARRAARARRWQQLDAEMQVVTQKWEAARQQLDEVNAKLVRPGAS